MLVGREAEVATLEGLLTAARLGKSGALLLRGEAGIGKTALLGAAADASDGFQVLRATGIESEAELPYATLHQLLWPLADRIDRLADPQARALRGALGLADEGEVDRFLVGVGTLTLLADAAEEQPLLALLDDAAWFDRASCDALGIRGPETARGGRRAAVRGPRRAGHRVRAAGRGRAACRPARRRRRRGGC